MLGRGLGEVPNEVDPLQDPLREPGDARIGPDQVEEASLAGEAAALRRDVAGRCRCGLLRRSIGGERQDHPARGLRGGIRQGVLEPSIRDGIAEEAERRPHRRLEVGRHAQELPEQAERPARSPGQERRPPGFLELATPRVDDLLAGQEPLLLRPKLGQLGRERGAVAAKLLQAGRERGGRRVEPLDLGLERARSRGETVDPRADVVERPGQALGLLLGPRQAPPQRVGLDPARGRLLGDPPPLVLGVPAHPLGTDELRLRGLELTLAGGERASDLVERGLRSPELLLHREQAPGAAESVRQVFTRSRLLARGQAHALLGLRPSLERRGLERLGGREHAGGAVAPLLTGRDRRVERREHDLGVGLLPARALPRRRAEVAVGQQVPEPGSGDPASQIVGLRRQCLVLGGQLGLLSQRLQLPTKLGHDVLEPVEVGLQAGQLPFRPFAPPAVLGDAGRLLDELAALLRPGGEHVLEVALGDDRVQGTPQTRVRQELLDVQEAARTSAQPVFALAGTEHGPAHLDLGGGHGDESARVVDHEPDLRHALRRPGRAPREDHVGHLPAPQRPGPLLAEDPRDGVGDVRLARPVRADDDAHAGRELEDGLVGERLEPADGEPAKEHFAGAA